MKLSLRAQSLSLNPAKPFLNVNPEACSFNVIRQTCCFLLTELRFEEARSQSTTLLHMHPHKFSFHGNGSQLSNI